MRSRRNDSLTNRKCRFWKIRWIHGEKVTEIVSEYRTRIKKPSSFYEQLQQQQLTPPLKGINADSFKREFEFL